MYAQLGQQPLARTTDAMRLKAALGLGAWASCDFSQVRAEAASTAAASAAEQQIELGQEDVRCEIGVRAAGVEPAALGHVHAHRDVEEQQRDGDGGGDEQQVRVELQQGRREPDSTAGHIELGRVDEQVQQGVEWQQQQQQGCYGGGARGAEVARRIGMFQEGL